MVTATVTDGQENASREFDRALVMALIAAKRQLGWVFVFLSIGVTAFADVEKMGAPFASRMMFKKSAQGRDRAWASVSDKMAQMRTGASAGMASDENDRRDQDEAQSARA